MSTNRHITEGRRPKEPILNETKPPILEKERKSQFQKRDKTPILKWGKTAGFVKENNLSSKLFLR